MLRALLIAAALVAMSIFASWPAVTHLGDLLVSGDPNVSVWDLWWMQESLFDLRNPWFTNAVLAPEGTYLGFHALIPLAGLVMTPVTALAGPVVASNLLKLLLPIVATLTARWLAREAGLRGLSAWVAGGLYGFSTIVMWRTGLHQNFGTGLAVLPVAPAAIVRYGRTRRRRDALLAGAGIGLLLLCDVTIAIFGVAALVSYALVAVVADRDVRAWATGVALAGVATVVVGAPQLAMMWRTSQQGAYEQNVEALAGNWLLYDTSLQTMFSPGKVREWFPGTLEQTFNTASVGEAVPTYGWGALGLALALLVVWVVRRRDVGLPRAPYVWAALLFVAGTWLALGPELTFSDDPHVPLAIDRHGQDVSALMPYTWLTYLPGLSDLRVPARFTMLAMLPLALLAGAGFEALRRNAGRAGLAVAAVLVAFAVLESGWPDGGFERRWLPGEQEAFYAPVKADKSPTIVVDVPLVFASGTYGAGRSHENRMEEMARATEHGHRIASGYLSRLTKEDVDRLVANPFYNGILIRQDETAPQIKARDQLATDVAGDMNVGWVVIQPSASRQVRRFIANSNFTFVHEMDGKQLWQRDDLAARDGRRVGRVP